MNAAGTMLQQITQSTDQVQPARSKDVSPDQTSGFRNLLMGFRNNTGNVDDSQHNLADVRDLVKKFLDSDEVNKLADQASSENDAKQMLTRLMNHITGQDGTLPVNSGQLQNTLNRDLGIMQGGDAEEDNVGESRLVNLQPPHQILNDQTLQKQFSALFAKVEDLLAQITDQKSISKSAPEFLKLLEQWSALAKDSTKQTSALMQSLPARNENNKAVWQELVQSFQKRNQLAVNHQYNTNAKVTIRDVAKWLQHAIRNQTQLDKATAQQALTFTSSMPMSKVEQYVIHLNQTNTQTVDHQLIEQFQKVMKSSKFMAIQNGTSQLNLSLRPENLGDMMVKLTQMNGEMTVKIVVTSAAAKEMLESNMHQLKNMFSPQQVVVEKQETSSQQTQTTQHEEDGQPMDDHNQEHSDADQDDKPHTEEDDFDLQLQEVLMNEKV
ncbi:flagellar hook-length control protein FliK [Lentibacillus sp. CBA3610]|uniref:flagellar hook-length control protein FliK n=1 Tax=Lentibacillus sp. CBA3610 TaxID=2518176 RepID=UPI001595F9CF|nr:flagellar hook-length control protein FliK [Lentibacillus sp. CBA3610]QKY69035.1 flagellar hook-length control protein FliK [Lentibacillus sp. CBA3610]